MKIKNIIKKSLQDRKFLDILNGTEDNTVIYNLNMLKDLINYYTYIASLNNISMYYSVKANNDKEILRIIQQSNISGVDCSSIYEYQKVKSINFKHINLTSVGFEKKDFYKFNLTDDNLDASTLNQLKLLCGLNYIKNVGVRVKGNSNFGISIKVLTENIDLCNKVTRLHFHGDSFETMKLKLINMHKIVEPKKIKAINFGGGPNALKILYQNEKNIIDFLKFASKLFPNARFEIEPGQQIVVACGFIISKIIDINENCAILNNSAFNLSSWYTPTILWSHLKVGGGKIIGNTNWKNDIFKSEIDISKLKINNRIIFGFTGAYYNTTYRQLHGYKFPRELYYKDGKLYSV